MRSSLVEVGLGLGSRSGGQDEVEVRLEVKTRMNKRSDDGDEARTKADTGIDIRLVWSI